MFESSSARQNQGVGRRRPLDDFGTDARSYSISPPRAKKPDPVDRRDYDTDRSYKATQVRNPAHAFSEYPYEKEPKRQPKAKKSKKHAWLPLKVSYPKQVAR